MPTNTSTTPKGNTYLIGTHKSEITFFRPNLGMLGYGRHFHYMKGVETPQYARAFVFKDAHKHFALVVVEFCFCTDNLKFGIIEKLRTESPELGYEDDNVMILAQHTHSTAGGYSQYMMYNLTIPGFQQDVYDHYRDHIVETIRQAHAKTQPATIRRQAGSFDVNAEIAFNRSIAAYNANPEVTQKLKHKTRHLAVDREMRLLRMDTLDGRPLAALNWFGVHTTSVSNKRNKVCYDNKGYAADYMETAFAEKYGADAGIISAFAQDASGDISPNFIWSRRNQEYRGHSEDDYENAGTNGRMQKDKAQELFDIAAQAGELLAGDIDYMQMYVDMTNVPIDKAFANGSEVESTSWAAVGLAFLEGTTDGQGLPKPFGTVAKGIFRIAHEIEVLAAKLTAGRESSQETLRHQRAQYPKHMFMIPSKGIILGTSTPEKLVIPSIVDPVIKYIKYMNTLQKRVRAPWATERVPIQIFIIGQMAFVGIPSEITTIAAQRLRKTILDVLSQRGVTHIQLCPFANSYAGYITTAEEYHIQAYEGGHTLYGKWTLAAYQMQYARLATEMLKPPAERHRLGMEPFMFHRDEIWRGFENKNIQVL